MSEDWFVERLDPGQMACFDILDQAFMSFPGISKKIRYKIPFYDFKSWLCYINPLKKGGLELCFVHGQKLSGFPSILEARNRIMIAGITIMTPQEAGSDLVLDCFSEAIILDETLASEKKKQSGFKR